MPRRRPRARHFPSQAARVAAPSSPPPHPTPPPPFPLRAGAPLRVLDALRVRLRVAEVRDGRREVRDLRLRAVLDEDGLAAPLDGDGLAGRDVREVHFDGREREDVSGRRERRDDVDHGEARGGGVEEARAAEDEVGEGALVGAVARGEAVRLKEVVGRVLLARRRGRRGGGRARDGRRG
jgi:hypothetical protein